MKIKSIKAYEILDSRGNPTVKVVLKTEKHIVTASVPSGKSKGAYEAVELRDGNRKRFSGLGVRKAVKNINEIIAKKIIGIDCRKQQKIDNLMLMLDGTQRKSRLGANAILAVSIAVCKAGAKVEERPLFEYIAELSSCKKPNLPRIYANLINGGMHAETKLSFQEFLAVPKAKGMKGIEQIHSIYYDIKSTLKKRRLSTSVGDEGGFTPNINNDEALEILHVSAKKIDKRVQIALDVAASSLFKSGYYFIPKKTSSASLLEQYKNYIKKYKLLSLEDPFAEQDLEAWQKATKVLNCMLVGDDLTATNPKRIELAKKLNLCTTLLIKPNQIGTITETILAANLAKKFKWPIIISHRSGDTCDSFIADLAVGLSAFGIKIGAPCRGERTAKYNRLIEIEQELK